MANIVDDKVLGEARPPSLWRNSSFLLLWSGQAVSTVGDRVQSIALPLLVLALTRSPAQAGLIAAAGWLPFLLFSLPSGALIDRWDRKAVMIRCDVIRWLAYGSVPFAAMLNHISIAQLYVVALVGGTCLVFFNVAQIAALPRVVTAGQLPQANAANATADSLASLLGPGIGGFLISLSHTIITGTMLNYAANSVSFLVSAVSLLFIRIPFQTAHEHPIERSLRAEISEGLHFLWIQQRLRTIALLTLSLNLFFSPIMLAMIVLARGPLHLEPRTIGLIFSISAGGGLIGAALAPWLRSHLRFGQVIVGSALIWALAMPLVALATSPLMLLTGDAILSMLNPVYDVTQISYRLTLIPDVLQGRVNSVIRLLAFGSRSFGMSIGGLLLGTLGPRPVLWLITAGIGFSALAVACTEVRKA